MSDFTDAFDSVEEPEENTPPEPPPEDLQKQVEFYKAEAAKAAKGEQRARHEAHRMKLLASYDEEIVNLIPETLPFKEREEFAEKLKALRGTVQEPAQAEEATPEAPQEEPTETEMALATANTSPASSTGTSFDDVSAMEIAKIGETDPARARQLMEAKFRSR